MMECLRPSDRSGHERLTTRRSASGDSGTDPSPGIAAGSGSSLVGLQPAIPPRREQPIDGRVRGLELAAECESVGSAPVAAMIGLVMLCKPHEALPGVSGLVT